MELDKAIEIQDLAVKDPDSVDDDDLEEAQKLGIEAMKRLKRNRIWPKIYHGGALPGETFV